MHVLCVCVYMYIIHTYIHTYIYIIFMCEYSICIVCICMYVHTSCEHLYNVIYTIIHMYNTYNIHYYLLLLPHSTRFCSQL